MNKEISIKIDEIINVIENSDVYQKYLLLKKSISENKELMKDDLDKLMQELNNHPLYIEYNNTIFEINNTYAIIENSLNNYFDKILN